MTDFEYGIPYDIVMRYGKLLKEKEKDDKLAQLWLYEDVPYVLIWDKKTGNNISYHEWGERIR